MPTQRDDLASRVLISPAVKRLMFRLSIGACIGVSLAPGTHPLVAQTRPKAPAAAPSSSAASGGSAWSLPEPSVLLERVLARIVSQDKPGAVPMNTYAHRYIGRTEALDAVKRYLGRSVELSPTAFSPVDAWTDARALQLPSCVGTECTPADNSVWLTVSKIERGDLASELNVWYTTSFAVFGEAGAQKASYAFCERWLRIGGSWRYDGFIRVTSGPAPG